MSKSNRRPQASKGTKSGNERFTGVMEAMQGKRFSNAAGPHRSATDYRRKPKHVDKGWD